MPFKHILAQAPFLFLQSADGIKNPLSGETGDSWETEETGRLQFAELTLPIPLQQPVLYETIQISLGGLVFIL
jgi:hypothetical protein